MIPSGSHSQIGKGAIFSKTMLRVTGSILSKFSDSQLITVNRMLNKEEGFVVSETLHQE